MEDTQLDISSYFQHEAWFEFGDVEKIRMVSNMTSSVKGKRLVNSYGRVRCVFVDGTYYDESNGKKIQQLDENTIIKDMG